ncbi:hypothetical protein [Roseibium sp.]|uniref:hypothetical protein n=1 Tax=Roseibium sp. TaxID=1936156 RepID=UPI003B51056A
MQPSAFDVSSDRFVCGGCKEALKVMQSHSTGIGQLVNPPGYAQITFDQDTDPGYPVLWRDRRHVSCPWKSIHLFKAFCGKIAVWIGRSAEAIVKAPQQLLSGQT